MFLKVSQNSQENCAGFSFTGLRPVYIKKETSAKVLSCEFCEAFKDVVLGA